MTLNNVQDQKNFTSALINALSSGQNRSLTESEIREKAIQLAELFAYSGDIESVVTEVMVAIDTHMGSGISLIDVNTEHDGEWVEKREDLTWTYSNAYEMHLRSEGWAPDVIQSLSDVSLRILGHLQDPLSEGAWDRRGLVIGHVQSGKTANYLGLISRAADVGYKFIIVIAGIHNNLRSQTQSRIDEGFVGKSSDPTDRKPVGVGLKVPHYPHPVTVTTIHDDFSKRTAQQSGWQLNDFSKPIVFVIKKNVTTLSQLYRWLKQMNAQGGGQITDVPMLMIDDEADNASINTSKDDLNPTRTNREIRNILSLFAKKCYVGYTATPFANIFINPDAYDDEDREELFPRDFIYSLDAPTSYFSPHKVFLDEERSDQILRPIMDGENYLPLRHKKDAPINDMPPSLYRAFRVFVIARAIRNLRGQRNKHCSMLINVSRFVDVQKTVRNFLSIYEKKLQDAVTTNYAMPETVSSVNPYMRALKDAFETEYAACEFSWEQVKSELHSVMSGLKLFVVNSKSDELLDYRRYEKEGAGLTAVAIGGLSLSRGLTIEGLTLSYMYRNTKMYDTLMQMGRWFGYRPGFEDLCRIYLSQDSISWYAHIAEASDELRQQIRRMRLQNLSPREFGLYVKAHPDSLLITAANKMRAGKEIVIKQNFSGKLIETTVLPLSQEISFKNNNLIREFWESGFGKGVSASEKTKKGLFFRDVSVDQIEDFISRFEVHPDWRERKMHAIEYLHAISDEFKYGDVLLISPDGNDADLKQFKLGFQKRKAIFKPDSSDRVAMNKDRVASRGDEQLGLSATQIHEAEHEARADEQNKNSNVSDLYYRRVRNKPLLMIHRLKITADGMPGEENISAFGLSFPAGLFSKEISVVVNRVWLEQMVGKAEDLPEEDEDFDE
ncbi:MAG: Z1 domain-containing protein [Candidatus Competibacteraceae bacterium]|nr:Z1 domain-containing protein [Candidatus Competibacteraceae bacterium]